MCGWCCRAAMSPFFLDVGWPETTFFWVFGAWRARRLPSPYPWKSRRDARSNRNANANAIGSSSARARAMWFGATLPICRHVEVGRKCAAQAQRRVGYGMGRAVGEEFFLFNSLAAQPQPLFTSTAHASCRCSRQPTAADVVSLPVARCVRIGRSTVAYRETMGTPRMHK